MEASKGMGPGPGGQQTNSYVSQPDSTGPVRPGGPASSYAENQARQDARKRYQVITV